MIGISDKYMRPKLLALALVILAAAVVVLAVRGCRHGTRIEKAAHEPRPVEVEVLRVTPTQIADEVSASGTVRAVAESWIAPKIMSNVAAVYVRQGDRVRRGQVLARLESRDLQAQVAQARAALAAAAAGANRASTAVHLQKAQTQTGIASAEAELKAAREQLSMAKEGARKQQKMQAQLAVAQAEAHFRNAQLEMDRMQRLYDQNVIPKQRLDTTRASYEVAGAQLESAKQQADLVEEGSRVQEVRALEERVTQAEESLRMAKASALQNRMSARSAEEASSQVSQARAALEYARVQLGYATITSPVSGVVTERLVDPGDTVSPGVPVICVEDDSLYRLEAAVPDKDASNLFVGGTVRVTIGSDGRVGEGRVSVLSPTGDPATRTVLAKIDIPKTLRPRSGEFGRVSIPVGFTKAVLVPRGAVHDDGGLAYVFVVTEENRAKMRVVKTGRALDGGVEVVSGLMPKDKVIVRNFGVVTDGVAVSIVGVGNEPTGL